MNFELLTGSESTVSRVAAALVTAGLIALGSTVYRTAQNDVVQDLRITTVDQRQVAVEVEIRAIRMSVDQIHVDAEQIGREVARIQGHEDRERTTPRPRPQ